MEIKTRTDNSPQSNRMCASECRTRVSEWCRAGVPDLRLSNLHADVLFQVDAFVPQVLRNGALELLGIEEFLIEQRALGEERLHLPLGDLLGDLLGLAGGLGLLHRDLALLGN